MTNYRKVSPELAKKAQIELNEVESRIPEDIAALREWIDKQPHLNARTDDQFLLTFLRGSKYSLERAKQKLDYFYTFKSIAPDLFLNNQITDKSIELSRLGNFFPLLKPMGDDGPCIVFSRYENIDLDEYTFYDLFKNQLRVANILMIENDNYAIAGAIIIVDMAHVKVSFLFKMDPVLGKKMGVFSDKALPIRVGGIHFVNFPPQFLTFVKMIEQIMPKKIKERMKFHSSLESLHEHVPKEFLPEEYGGNNGSISESIDALEKLLIKYKPYFDEENQYKTDESLRIGTKVTSESLFGLEGSFRKLEVD